MSSHQDNADSPAKKTGGDERRRQGGRGRGPQTPRGDGGGGGGGRGGGGARDGQQRRGNRRRGGGGGGGAGMSDEDVLIAFAPLLRDERNNAEAMAIHARFSETGDTATFTSEARDLLFRLSSSSSTPSFPRASSGGGTHTPGNDVGAVSSPQTPGKEDYHHDGSCGASSAGAVTATELGDSLDEDIDGAVKDGAGGAALEAEATTTAHPPRGESKGKAAAIELSSTPPLSRAVEEGDELSDLVRGVRINDDVSAARTAEATGVPSVGADDVARRPPPPPPPPPGFAVAVDNISTGAGGGDVSVVAPTLDDPATSVPTSPTAMAAVEEIPHSSTATDETTGDGELGSGVTRKQQPPQTQTHQHQPRRLMRDQPGSIVANGVAAPNTLLLNIRQELNASWSVPLRNLSELLLASTASTEEEEDAASPRRNGDHPSSSSTSVVMDDPREIIESLRLTVGLFRLGTPENWNAQTKGNSSIVSKRTTSFSVDDRGIVRGRVPFYAPRTPGNVVLRLYAESSPVRTLATGPFMTVCVTDYVTLDATLRFVLSNFKSKAGTGTVCLGSVHNVASILESWTRSREAAAGGAGGRHAGRNGHRRRDEDHDLDSAGRALWGCLCESRKVVEAARAEHEKKVRDADVKIAQLQDVLTAMDDGREVSIDNEQAGGTVPIKSSGMGKETEADCLNDKCEEEEIEDEKKKAATQKKMGALMKDRAFAERKWRDVQGAYASVLHVMTHKESLMNSLLRRDQLGKVRLEYLLWCPLCESFAPMPDSGSFSSGVGRNIGGDPKYHHQRLVEACIRSKRAMQNEVLGYIPADDVSLERLFSSTRAGAGADSVSRPHAVIQSLSTAMQTMYQSKVCPSRDFYSIREGIRLHMERIVNSKECNSHFPPGTRVLVFGSSANGFGSASSDLDMCLHLPSDVSKSELYSDGGRAAMAALAEQLEAAGMKDVDSTRLTARIPVVMFHYPIGDISHNEKTEREANSEEEQRSLAMVDCDISMENPLAVLNTRFLRMFSMLDDRIPVLASIVKRFAKGRDINDPSHHTLSSYGYLLMLIHFLLQDNNRQGRGLHLPNLLWLDPRWDPGRDPYQEMTTRQNMSPEVMVPHPTQAEYSVNTYFYQPRDDNQLQMLQRHVQANNANTPVGMLLAQFFRYYAFEFDYKKHVISLNGGGRRGMIEKEHKAELDGWRLSSLMAIEDPFESFYDVAHVVKSTQFYRIRREFALAYTKIVQTCLNGPMAKDVNSGDELIAFLTEKVPEG